MSSSMLHINPDELNTPEKRGKYRISIVGCGKNGTIHAYLFAEAGFRVACIDPDQIVVNNTARGKTFLGIEAEPRIKNHVKSGQITVTTDLRTTVSNSDVILITTPIQVDEKEKTDRSALENVCRKVGSSLHQGSLVILAEITGMDFTEGFVKEVLENTSGFRVGAELGLAYSPARLLQEQTPEALVNQERIVGAADKNSLDATAAFLATISKNGIRKAKNLRTAEMAILLDAVQHDVNVALSNEVAVLCEKAGTDWIEIIELIDHAEPNKILPPMAQDEKAQTATNALMEDAEITNARLRLPALAQQVNEEAIWHAVNLAKEALRDCGKTLRRARICLFGLSQTPNIKDSQSKIAKKLARMLEARGAKVSLYDPYFSGDEMSDTQKNFKRTLTEALEGADCIMILTAHDQFKRLSLKKFKALMKRPAAVVDLKRIVEPDKIEKEGFIYRGFGRGEMKK